VAAYNTYSCSDDANCNIVRLMTQQKHDYTAATFLMNFIEHACSRRKSILIFYLWSVVTERNVADAAAEYRKQR